MSEIIIKTATILDLELSTFVVDISYFFIFAPLILNCICVLIYIRLCLMFSLQPESTALAATIA